ncbi:hypothetical protein Clim_2340 [Chlorobium limicola DSM 245]|uniref:Uncharacterized protein n=1 Tax=Chlorobium limicola (strain DSM 245 / NBRC 103803 / 6330) TaxID=290315 RepID=B3EHV4_CHLL2|nr:hypothetical protein Clim_2340 [Chlorobium limicola DSM 245]
MKKRLYINNKKENLSDSLPRHLSEEVHRHKKTPPDEQHQTEFERDEGIRILSGTWRSLP